MKKVLINGLSESQVSVFLTFMEEKTKDEAFVKSIEMCGNDCDLSWMEDGMDISGEDMVHELFEMYGTCKDDKGSYAYELKVGDITFQAWKEGCEWDDEYYVK